MNSHLGLQPIPHPPYTAVEDQKEHNANNAAISRRAALKTTLAAAGAAAFGPEAFGAETAAKPDARRSSTKQYNMKKSINQWAFPYPDRMSLRECLQLAKDAGFDGIEPDIGFFGSDVGEERQKVRGST